MIFITMIVLSLIGVSAFDSLKLCVPFSGEATLCKLGYFVQMSVNFVVMMSCHMRGKRKLIS